MRTLKLTLQYDGTNYAGFQRQSNGITIQERLEYAMRIVTGDPLIKIGAAAGRTDAGVHARGQVVHLQTDSGIPTDRWPYALNQHLPADIVAVGAEEVSQDFHARYWAVSKRYRYTLETGPFHTPMTRLYAYHWPRALDLEAMRLAALLLAGRQDFAAFRSAGGSAKNSIRTVHALSLTEERPFLYLDIEADGFLYNMVRIIAGTLLEVGAGRRSLADVAEALQTGERRLAGKTLSPHGLSLEIVHYRDESVAGPGITVSDEDS